jgi:large conductance mechanosensitive channel
MQLMEELQYFLLNGTIADFAVAVIFGQTFSVVIGSFVSDIIIPMISALTYKVDVDRLFFKIRGVDIKYGDFLGNLFTFIASMLLVFFIFIRPFKEAIKETDDIKEKKENSKTSKVIDSIANIERILEASSQRLRI